MQYSVILIAKLDFIFSFALDPSLFNQLLLHFLHFDHILFLITLRFHSRWSLNLLLRWQSGYLGALVFPKQVTPAGISALRGGTQITTMVSQLPTVITIGGHLEVVSGVLFVNNVVFSFVLPGLWGRKWIHIGRGVTTIFTQSVDWFSWKFFSGRSCTSYLIDA